MGCFGRAHRRKVVASTASSGRVDADRGVGPIDVVSGDRWVGELRDDSHPETRVWREVKDVACSAEGVERVNAIRGQVPQLLLPPPPDHRITGIVVPGGSSHETPVGRDRLDTHRVARIWGRHRGGASAADPDQGLAEVGPRREEDPRTARARLYRAAERTFREVRSAEAGGALA